MIRSTHWFPLCRRGSRCTAPRITKPQTNFPCGYSDWREVIAKKTEVMEVREAKEAPKPKTKRKTNSKAKPQESPEDITETTPHGYFAKRNRQAQGRNAGSAALGNLQERQRGEARVLLPRKQQAGRGGTLLETRPHRGRGKAEHNNNQQRSGGSGRNVTGRG